MHKKHQKTTRLRTSFRCRHGVLLTVIRLSLGSLWIPPTKPGLRNLRFQHVCWPCLKTLFAKPSSYVAISRADFLKIKCFSFESFDSTFPRGLRFDSWWLKKPLRCTVPFSQLFSEQIQSNSNLPTFKNSGSHPHESSLIIGNFRVCSLNQPASLVSRKKWMGNWRGYPDSMANGKRPLIAVSFRETTESIQVFH